MSNLYRGSSKDASYQVSIHLVKWFPSRRFFRNQAIINKNCLWRKCLLTDRNKISNLYKGPSKDASYQILIYLAMQAVSEETIFQKSTNKKQELPVVAMIVNGSEVIEQSLYRIFPGCFLPNFDSFGHAVTEEKIFQKSTNQKQEVPVAAMSINGSG